MRIVTITVAALNDPIEVQQWFDSHLSSTVKQIILNSNVFYIFYD